MTQKERQQLCIELRKKLKARGYGTLSRCHKDLKIPKSSFFYALSGQRQKEGSDAIIEAVARWLETDEKKRDQRLRRAAQSLGAVTALTAG